MNAHHLSNIIKSGNLLKLDTYFVTCGFSDFEIKQLIDLMKSERTRETHPIKDFLLLHLTDKQKVYQEMVFLTRPEGSKLGNLPFAFMQREQFFIQGINFDAKQFKSTNHIWWSPIVDHQILMFAQYCKKYAKECALGLKPEILGFVKSSSVPIFLSTPIPSQLIK